LPYTPLYYFLLEKTSPTRDLIFIKQDPLREAFNLEHITKKNVRYILLSNRALRPMESRLGIFGQTYGMEINNYLEENFEPVATFGPFESLAGWTDNHAVKIYRKIN
ncbi:MAG: hypothetical protein KC684_08160, partial [Candidatus Omnitrophica bacterium]|nr:hypothetical protein [Candidatus Omnitrophota bacterium]